MNRRFWSKVKRTENGCWEWTGARLKPKKGRVNPPPSSFGYGLFGSESGKTVLAHRWLYEKLHGPIEPLPNGKARPLDHVACDNPPCVRPDHLEPKTRRENTLRGVGPSAVNAVKTHCPKGHPYDDANTWIDKTGRRHCRTCKAASYDKWYRQQGKEYHRQWRDERK